MKLRPSLAMISVLLWSFATWSQDAGSGPAKHDINGRGCAACHVVPAAPPAEKHPDNACNKTLWDCDLPNRIFQTYEAPARAPEETHVRMSSMLCASCHDGVSTFTMSSTAGFRARSSTHASAGLQNEHPIDVSHDPAKDPSLAALAVVTHQVKLFGETNKVQCATCHDVHDANDSKLLRTPNKSSSLCLACHL